MISTDGAASRCLDWSSEWTTLALCSALLLSSSVVHLVVFVAQIARKYIVRRTARELALHLQPNPFVVRVAQACHVAFLAALRAQRVGQRLEIVTSIVVVSTEVFTINAPSTRPITTTHGQRLEVELAKTRHENLVLAVQYPAPAVDAILLGRASRLRFGSVHVLCVYVCVLYVL